MWIVSDEVWTPVDRKVLLQITRKGCKRRTAPGMRRPGTGLAWLTGAIMIAMVGCRVEAHEAWIEPFEFEPDAPSLLSAHLRVGQLFRGNTLLYNPEQFQRLDVTSASSTAAIKGRLGDLPAIRHRVTDDGLHIIVFVSTGQRIHYENWEKFERFAQKEGLDWLLDAHRLRGLPEGDFSETYFRHAKSLVMAGTGGGLDRPLGLRHEIVLQQDPYTHQGPTFRAGVLWQGNPQPGTQLTVFRKDPAGNTTREVVPTDASGEAVFARHPGHRYLLNAVHALPVEEPVRNGPVWLTHWASTTFLAN